MLYISKLSKTMTVHASKKTTCLFAGLLLLFCTYNTRAQATMPEMVLVDGGTFVMGSSDKKAEDEEKPAHKVTVSSFYIAKHEVTVAQYKLFCKETKRKLPDAPKWGFVDNHPIVNVSWNDAKAYCDWLAKKTSKPYRLPTEAEWEFAAKGGTKSKNTKFAGSNDIDQVAWYDKNAKQQTQPVGKKAPNELGLYDMTGNVWEWCNDWFKDDYYGHSPAQDPPGASKGTMKSQRSGSWVNYNEDNRITIRISNLVDDTGHFAGFRVAMSK